MQIAWPILEVKNKCSSMIIFLAISLFALTSTLFQNNVYAQDRESIITTTAAANTSTTFQYKAHDKQNVIETTQDVSLRDCIDAADKKHLKVAWSRLEPYQFSKTTDIGHKLVGLDIELLKYISDQLNISLEYAETDWQQSQEDVKAGTFDMISSVSFSEERAKYGYFSKPYRFEENSLFALKDSPKRMIFQNTDTFLAQIKMQNFRLGVVSGVVYASEDVNQFINDQQNSDLIFYYTDEDNALMALLRREIDGFICDRIVGSTIVLNQSASGKVEELRLNIKSPVHILFSKASTPIEVVNKFDDAIEKFVWNNRYKTIIKNYLYPILLIEIIDSYWFYLLGMLGTIAFAISGLAIAAKEEMTLFGAFLISMMPSVWGGIMRDVIINRANVGIILTPSYIYYIMFVTILGFFTFRLIKYYLKEENYSSINQFCNNLFIVCDALGQASFIVIGVAVVVMVRIEPIELWGAFFAFLTASGGCIVRDVIIQKSRSVYATGSINAEISVLWGLIFALFLNFMIYEPDPSLIKYAVFITVIGATITRLLVVYFKIPNIRISSNANKNYEDLSLNYNKDQ